MDVWGEGGEDVRDDLEGFPKNYLLQVRPRELHRALSFRGVSGRWSCSTAFCGDMEVAASMAAAPSHGNALTLVP